MPRAGFYVENEYRDYPFVTRTAPFELTEGSSEAAVDILPHEAIADAGFIMGLDVGFDPDQDTVYLAEIRRDGDMFTYDFRTTAAGAVGIPLLFRRTIGDEDHLTEWQDAYSATDSSSSSSSLAAVCEDEPVWSGYMVHGRLLALDAALIDGQSLQFPAEYWMVEPARIQVLHYLRSLNLANYSRTHIVVDQCEDPADVRTLYVNARCIRGDVVFSEGYNCTIVQEDRRNAITIRAGVGSGLGEPCEEIAIYDGEVSPDGGSYLTGGPRCDEILKTLNGVGGRDIRLVGGPGFHVAVHPVLESTVVVTLDLSLFNFCANE